jgi:hypothetical protein
MRGELSNRGETKVERAKKTASFVQSTYSSESEVDSSRCQPASFNVHSISCDHALVEPETRLEIMPIEGLDDCVAKTTP